MADHTGLEQTVLSKAWEGKPAGSSVWTDPARAAWLRDNGYEAKAEELSDETGERKPSKRKRKE